MAILLNLVKSCYKKTDIYFYGVRKLLGTILNNQMLCVRVKGQV